MSHVRCPRCTTVLARVQAGRLKIRLGLIAFRKGGDGVICETVCPGCRADVALPLALADEGLAKSLDPPPVPRAPANLRLTIPAQTGT